MAGRIVPTMGPFCEAHNMSRTNPPRLDVARPRPLALSDVGTAGILLEAFDSDVQKMGSRTIRMAVSTLLTVGSRRMEVVPNPFAPPRGPTGLRPRMGGDTA